ncbi:hypothetical protein DAKH74_058290 [Maudiozyma humilis]|uniref:Uncharacterized protein n=1 Tax=Maudiozyma humilis TaxID=51915 RepID=A0AAV5SCR4_MAUHU|nr:hypothetical protein DAKH74_058290 [Kazachstania humilis]
MREVRKPDSPGKKFKTHEAQVKDILDVLETLPKDELSSGDVSLAQAYLEMVKRRTLKCSNDTRRLVREEEMPSPASKRQKVPDFPPNYAAEFSNMAKETGMLGMARLGGNADWSDRQESSDEYFETDLEVTGSDHLGYYLTIRTRRYGTVRFHHDLPGFIEPLKQAVWRFPQDFPKWCVTVSDYIDECQLDNVILGDKLTTDEEEAVRILLERAIEVFHQLRLNTNVRGSRLFAKLKQKAASYFTRSQKDTEWEKILADETLGDPSNFINKINCLRFMEECTENKSEQVVTDHFISRQLLGSLCPSFSKAVIDGLPKDTAWWQRSRGEIHAEIVKYLDEQPFYDEDTSKTCAFCHSTFHSRPNCPLEPES